MGKGAGDDCGRPSMMLDAATLPSYADPRVPGDASSAIAAFGLSDPRLTIWARYPHISEEEDELTDSWACRSVSQQFVDFARGRGLDAVLVHGDQAEHGMHLEHYWVRIKHASGELDVDFTARQFYDLEQPPLPQHQDLPCPVVWPANGQHPISGRYGSVTALPSAED